jgi:hypothetical protein
MSKESTTTDFPAGDFISENAVRAVFGRRRPTLPTGPVQTGDAARAHSREDTEGPAVGARRLRRWSVSELIARAVPPPPSTT